MKCPYCHHKETQVKDTRTPDNESVIKRRRVCLECGAKFSTIEQIQIKQVTVIKKDSSTEPLSRDKIFLSLRLALRKRPFNNDQLEKLTTSIIQQIESGAEVEIESSKIGDVILNRLKEIDPIAYIRYISVYKDFKNVEDFQNIIISLQG